MAHLRPSDLTPLSLSLGETAELRTLDLLRRGLPADYTVYHSVHWSLATASRAMFGEVDFIVVNRAGEVLAIEQKAGALHETSSGLVKHYEGSGAKAVAPQIHRGLESLRKQFSRQTGGGTLSIDYLFYCPDHRVLDPLGAGLAAERIVDAAQAQALPARIMALLGTGKAGAEGARVHRFFENVFQLVPDIHAHVREGERAMARLLSSGLVGSVLAIEMAPMRLRVRGTAGSGKSSLALRLVERAVEAGRRPLLVCFNRPLAEKLKAAAPDGAVVSTFHGLLDRFLQSRGHKVNFANVEPGFWAGLVERVIGEMIGDDWRFDALIVDEGQDFEPDWFDVLRLFPRDSADVVWLEDADQAIRQNLGDRPGLEAAFRQEGFIGYRARTNYRTPQSIAGFIADRLPRFTFEAVNPLPGLGVGESRVKAADELPKRVGAIVTDLVKQGFRQGDIVVLSLRGLGVATLANAVKVGSFSLSRPTGEYDLLGNQLHSPGQIRFDTIHRFKGQEAPAVILTDVGAPPDDAQKRAFADRLLFSAMTRATVRLEIVSTT